MSSFVVHFLLRYFHCLFSFATSFSFLHSHKYASLNGKEDAYEDISDIVVVVVVVINKQQYSGSDSQSDSDSNGEGGINLTK